MIKGADVMCLSFDEGAIAEAEEIESGVFARYGPNTKELVGLTVTKLFQKIWRQAQGSCNSASDVVEWRIPRLFHLRENLPFPPLNQS